MSKTRVHLTIDVECAEERLSARGFEPARGYDLRIWGRLRNQPEELGIPLITRELTSYGLRATFFIEPFGASHFGEAGLMDVCGFLRARGQDLQVHAHPVQRCADWYTRREPRLPDDMAAYGAPMQVALLRQAIATLERCGVARESLRAFRAGNFGAGNDTWRAMATVGLRVSCNFNLCYLDESCRLLWPTPANSLFDTGQGVYELPVTNFSDGHGHFRHLQVSAVSFGEMKQTLLEANRLGLSDVTIVTHPFEYFLVDSVADGTGRANTMNIERLRSLCSFLAERADLFEVETVGTLAARLERGEVRPEGPLVVPRGKRALRYGRFAEQAYKRLTARLPL